VECLKLIFIPHGLEMIVVLSRFTIANDMAEEVRFAFRQQPQLVEEVPGFLGMEVMSLIGNPAEVWLLPVVAMSKATLIGTRGTSTLSHKKVYPKSSSWCQFAQR
jgi:hypothetical protein